ncbi:hypothetical protein ACWGB8_01800 [Kitasatospora sp. NPDC054939]
MQTTATAPRITAGLVAVHLPDGGPAMRSTWIEPDAVIVGYDPRVLDEDLVRTILQSVHSDSIVIVAGVPE